VARPTDYVSDYAEQAEKLCKLGATDVELADFFEVVESTINLWKLTHSEFSESIKRGKVQADANVAQRLYERAMGYSHPEVHVSSYEGAITLTPLTKHYPPEPTAAIFWLKNRQPHKWRDRSHTEISGPDGGPIVVAADVIRQSMR
jgi:hypothetical protein